QGRERLIRELLSFGFQSASHRNRHRASSEKIAAKPSNAAEVVSAELISKPRQVIASSPSIAHRVGTTNVSCCNQAGNRNDGIHAPPSISMTSTASMETPRTA